MFLEWKSACKTESEIDCRTEEGDAYKAREDLFLKWFQQNDRLRVDAICATFSSADISLQEHKIDFLLGVSLFQPFNDRFFENKQICTDPLFE